ncbi:MAG TPA: hypothetical protein VFD58_32050 [Blastocatellia bacterium]|nr:hypothetical protein [Blastocatellia bacterium]
MRSRSELFIPVSSLSIARYPRQFAKALEVEPLVFWSDDRSEAIVEGQGGDYQIQVEVINANTCFKCDCPAGQNAAVCYHLCAGLLAAGVTVGDDLPQAA